MKRCQIHPFYFPTTVMFVDDNAAFLANLSLQLDEDLAYKLFDSALEALVHVNAVNRRPSLTHTYFSKYRDIELATPSNHLIDLNLDKIHREVYQEQRFEEISVAVIDYAMPEMDGLEFCRNIKHPAIKKILLTGRADEKLAVRAFNEGLIDRFIMKGDSVALATLNAAIGELQQEYFGQVEQILADALSIETPSFLLDPVFGRHFGEICRARKVVEYYLCSNPNGILMLDAQGSGTLLLISTEEDLRAHYEVAFDQAAPEALLTRLRSGKSIPYFWQYDGHYQSGCTNWDEFLYPASEIQGAQWYFYAAVENPPRFKLNTVLSYHTFLSQLDQRGRARDPDDPGYSQANVVRRP
jgi:CheY-like chemotaxis protein